MSFKSIEMQIAIPRTTDASRMQDQMMKQGQQFQDTLTQKQLREDMIRRQTVNETDEIEKGAIRDEDEANNPDNNEQDEADKHQEKNKSIDHPYLGTKIDFSG